MDMAVIVANWKMNKVLSEAIEFTKALKSMSIKNGRKVIIAPPFVYLNQIVNELKGTEISVSAQNMFYEDKGAYTGEISPLQLIDIGVEYVIIGHSERRNIFKEDDELISKKLKSAISHNLTPIFCIGEKIEERRSGKTFEIIKKQLTDGLKLINADEIYKIIFAYEPVWAIGTGVNATPEQAGEVHQWIKAYLEKKYLNLTGESVKILYGGSVTAENAKSLMSIDGVDGLLVGGASLKIDSFEKIINF
ncbi:MAG: triose-phosphate isomerase [Proteobacteria bacterium]|nr:triose-phosphate isomerase [Pseudomonadota bacterium]